MSESMRVPRISPVAPTPARVSYEFETDEGTRWNTYTILPDGRMRMNAVTSASMLPRDLRFQLIYRRQARWFSSIAVGTIEP